MALYIYKFNNYYNRILKRFESLEEYGEPVTIVSNTNFNPNDEITTTHVVNFEGEECDYAINTQGEVIESRWFIIEKVRIRAGQYQLTLFRDTLADYFNETINAVTYVEKAWLRDITDPAIYNEENFEVNQIKTKETLLKDRSKSAWIVGYYDKDTPVEYLKGTINLGKEDFAYTQLTGDLDSWIYNSYTTSAINGPPDPTSTKIILNYGIHPDVDLSDTYCGAFTYNKGGIITHKSRSTDLNRAPWLNREWTKDNIVVGTLSHGLEQAMANVQSESIWFEQANTYLNFTPSSTYNTLLAQEGKLLKTLNGEFYKVKVETLTSSNQVVRVPAGSLFNSMTTAVQNAVASPKDDPSNVKRVFMTNSLDINSLQVSAKVPVIQLKYVRQANLEAEYDLSNTTGGGTGSIQTQGVPYNIFCIPYNQIQLYLAQPYQYTFGDPDTAIALAAGIQAKMQQYLYDIQLLPFCPIPNMISQHTDGRISPNSTKQYSLIYQATQDQTATVAYAIFHVPSPSFIVEKIPVDDLKVGATILDRKVNRQCNKYRLCSPNYSNYFDFSPELNDGLSYFTVDCEYKPYSPYIHINPNFGGLYGQDFNDPRGLILGGDFSLSQIIDQWQTYQINNKNFEKIFDRQIDNLEVQHKYGRTQDITNAVTGTLSGIVSGMTGGGLAFGGKGAIAGGITGGIAALGGGIADVMINEKLRDEAKDYATDLYYLQKGNIQALPNTLGKVSAYNPNNKIFPVLEYYTCTEREKQAFIDKLYYNGMTINRIDQVATFLGDPTPRYIKGQLIRINLHDDMHLTNTIANELNKGVFI